MERDNTTYTEYASTRCLVLSVVTPFRLDLTAWALRRRSRNLMDRWQHGQYVRAFVVAGQVYRVTVEQEQAAELKVEITSSGDVGGDVGGDVAGAWAVIAQQIAQTLGLQRDLSHFYTLAGDDPHLGPLAERFAGLKPPRFPTIFETLVNAMSCQQVSLDLGILLLDRLTEHYGPSFGSDPPALHAFPRPEDLAEASPENLRSLGYSHQKARAILDLAQSISDNALSLSGLENMTNEEVVRRLREVRGVGRWTAEYVLLRGLGRLDVFPGDDVGAQKNLQELLHLERRPDYEDIKRLTARWEPYAGLVYFHLLMSKLRQKGLV